MEIKYNISDSKLHISKGNTKMGKGIWSFATVPGNSEHRPTLSSGVLLSNVVGTCSKYCEGCAKNGACYAWRDYMLHNNVVVKAWGENTNLLRSGKLFEELDKFISGKNKNLKDPKIKTFRINTSGELENLEQLEGWNNLALKHSEVIFSIYTKNYDVVESFLLLYGDTAANFVINISQWHHVADTFLNKCVGKGKFNIFEYDDSNKKDNALTESDLIRLKSLNHCPAVTFSGHHAKTPNGDIITCDKCGKCYSKTGKTTAVYAH